MDHTTHTVWSMAMNEAMDWTSFACGIVAGLWVAIGLRDLGEYMRGRKK